MQQDASTIKTPHQPCFSSKSVYFEVPFGGLEWDFHGFSKAFKAEEHITALAGTPGDTSQVFKADDVCPVESGFLVFLGGHQDGGLNPPNTGDS